MIGDLNPFSRFTQIPLLKDIELNLYGAAGWVFNRDVHWSDLSDISAEAGAVASISPLDILLPTVIVDAIHSPDPVKLSFFVPFYAHSPLLRGDELRYRFAISVSM
jgi:hypothetical protein